MTEQEWKNRMTNPKYNELQITTHKDNKPYVFISYKSDSWEQVLTEIVYKLQKEYGLRIYFDKSFNDNNNVWTEQFPTNMSDPNCKAVLAFVDNEYYLSYATLLEIMYSQTYKASVGKKKGLAVIPVNLETIKEPSGDEGKEDTGLGVQTFSDGTKNFNAGTEKELFDKIFGELTDRKIWKTAQYIYDKEMLSKSVCSIMMGEMFSFIRVSENPYKSGMVEFYDSLVKTIKSVAPDVFDDVADSTLEEIDWSEFDKVKSFSYNGEFYNVLDAQNAYISIVDILHQNDLDINPNNLVDGVLPKYVKFEDGTELDIPKNKFESILKDTIKDKVVLYAEHVAEGKSTKNYEILSRDSKKEVGDEATEIFEFPEGLSGTFSDSLAHFAHYFSRLYDMRNIAWKEGNNIGKMPSIDMETTICFNCDYLEHYCIKEHSLKKMFANIIEYFYQMSGERYFDYIVDFCAKTRTKYPMVINESFTGDKKLYSKISDSIYWVYNNYSAKEIFVYLNKHVEMYFNYLIQEGISVNVEDVIVDYKITDKKDAEMMQKIRTQGFQTNPLSSGSRDAGVIGEKCITFEAESFVEFVKIFEKVADNRTREYKEKKLGNAPAIPFSNIVLYLPENVANVNEVKADGWQELFKAVIDSFYDSTNGEYCEIRANSEMQKNIKTPKFVSKAYAEEGKINYTYYQLCANGRYYYYNCYKSANVLKEIRREISLYMDYFADSRGIQDDIASVKISYTLPESYADLFR